MTRSKIITYLRSFLDQLGFLEVWINVWSHKFLFECVQNRDFVCVNLPCWFMFINVSDWDTDDEHYSRWSRCPSICYLPQWAGYEPVHEDRSWALPQGNPSLWRAIFPTNQSLQGRRCNTNFNVMPVNYFEMHRFLSVSFLKCINIYVVYHIFPTDACGRWTWQSVWDWSSVQKWRHWSHS